LLFITKCLTGRRVIPGCLHDGGVCWLLDHNLPARPDPRASGPSLDAVMKIDGRPMITDRLPALGYHGPILVPVYYPAFTCTFEVRRVSVPIIPTGSIWCTRGGVPVMLSVMSRDSTCGESCRQQSNLHTSCRTNTCWPYCRPKGIRDTAFAVGSK
jgi:hypothetical protein